MAGDQAAASHGTGRPLLSSVPLRAVAAAWRATYPSLVPDGYLDDGLTRAWAREGFEQALADPHIRQLVAELNGTVVGIVQLNWSDEGVASLWRL